MQIGKKNGQVKLFRNGDIAEAYQVIDSMTCNYSLNRYLRCT